LKGVTAVWIAKVILGLPVFAMSTSVRLHYETWWVVAAAIAVIVGHIFPIWLRFRGGKGVATGVGVFLILAPIAVALAAVIFLLVVWRTRYVSLGSILAAVSIPLFLLGQHAFIATVEMLAPIMSAAMAGAALIVFAHRENIRRLINGNENRFK
jgi:glycerol-3-phosphate acyltransferase PlsY